MWDISLQWDTFDESNPKALLAKPSLTPSNINVNTASGHSAVEYQVDTSEQQTKHSTGTWCTTVRVQRGILAPRRVRRTSGTPPTAAMATCVGQPFVRGTLLQAYLGWVILIMLCVFLAKSLNHFQSSTHFQATSTPARESPES